MNELKDLFYRSVETWIEDSNGTDSLFDHLGITQEEYTNIFQSPKNLFYVFYHNEHFQNVILNTLETTNNKGRQL